MGELIVSQNRSPFEIPHLRISHLRESFYGPLVPGKLEFRYIDSCLEGRTWSRVVPCDAAWERLLHFFEQLGWFRSFPGEVRDRIN